MKGLRISAWGVRRAAVAILLVITLALAAGWTSIPARAGAGASATDTEVSAAAPSEIVVSRVAVIDPMSLSAQFSTAHRGAHPLRVADPAAYLQMKSALASG
jgi:hypothetical protein